MTKTNKQGYCPKCNSMNLTYGKEYRDEDTLIYPFTCDDCKIAGMELNTIEYDETVDYQY